MRPRIRGAMGFVAALALTGAATAGAAEPRWSQPRPVASAGAQAVAQVDDAGKVSVTWRDRYGPGRILGAVREPRASAFTAPFEIGHSDGPTRLAVLPNGEIALLSFDRSCGSPACGLTWFLQLGTDLRRMGPRTPVGPGATGPGFAAAPSGRLMMAWPTPDGKGVMVVERPPGATRFGAPALIPAPLRLRPSFPSVAVNSRGDAAIAFTTEHWEGARGDVPISTHIALRRAGGGFGVPSRMGPPATGSLMPGLALSGDGSTTLFLGQGSAAYRQRPPGGPFGPTMLLGTERVEMGSIATNAAGAAAAFWWQHLPGTGETRERPYERASYVATKPPGQPFGPGRIVDLPGAEGFPSAGVDQRGNVLVTWASKQDGRLRAGSLGRFENTNEVSPPLSAGRVSEAGAPSANAAGHAVAAFTEWGPGLNGEGGPVRVIERAADPSLLELIVDPLQLANGVVSTRVRCGRPCEARLRIAAPGRARTRAARSVVIRGGARRIRARLSRAQRRALRRHGKKRVTVELRAVASWGRPRVVRRSVPASRLLGRR